MKITNADFIETPYDRSYNNVDYHSIHPIFILMISARGRKKYHILKKGESIELMDIEGIDEIQIKER